MIPTTPLLPAHSPLLSRVPHSQRERSVPLYHYTTADRLCGILTQRAIQPATLGVIPPEIPAVWLSTAPLWEASATKGVIRQGRRRTASLAELLETSGCLVRIHIDPAALEIIPAAELDTRLRIPSTTWQGLCHAGRAMGAEPSQWRAVAGPIPASAFQSIEISLSAEPVRWLRALAAAPA
jgi:hypothetical protein